MFEQLAIHGGAGALVLGYKDAVVLKGWSIAKVDGQWRLTASVARVDPFLSRQTPLYFSAPLGLGVKGFWCWGVEGAPQIGNGHLLATLGPPER